MWQRLKVGQIAVRLVAIGWCLVLGTMAGRADDALPVEATAAKSLSKAFQRVAENAAPSLVSLEVRMKPGLGWTWWQSTFPSSEPSHVGSGFVIDKKGTVLTAYHVVEHAQEVVVRTHDGHESVVTTILSDPQTDVAILRVPAANNVKPLRIGASDKLELGEWVVAIGNPNNTGVTLTPGVISTKGKGPATMEHADFLETTAIINLGNCGGPLLNLDGEVVGINTLFQHPNRVYAGIHFAVPSNTAQWVAEQLSDHGKVLRSYIGVSVQELDPKTARAHRLIPRSGVVVSGIMANSPASEAGIHAGDILVECNGHRVFTPRDLQRRVEVITPGKTIDVALLRDGQRQVVAVKVREYVGPAMVDLPQPATTSASKPEATP